MAVFEREVPSGLLHALQSTVLSWYETHARDLPWRRPGATPWAILVSEVMLQQTPVARVLPVYDAWLRRWPTPSALASDQPGEAVRQWGRLGYPRRALRLHQTAIAIVDQHDGAVPATYDALRALPGIGDYTAAAVASFAFRRRHAVLDTNVRRVLTRVLGGEEYPAPAATVGERRVADQLVPDEPEVAARWSAAVMEVGAVVCTARSPRCDACPLAQHCAWRLAGRPTHAGPVRRGQRYEGTDRQCRGALLHVLRQAAAPVSRRRLQAVWSDQRQRERALDSLVADGLVEPLSRGRYRLPGQTPATRG